MVIDVCGTGSENSLCIITEKEIIEVWKIGLSLQSNVTPQKQELSDDDNGSAACSIITIETRPEEQICPNPIFGYYDIDRHCQ